MDAKSLISFLTDNGVYKEFLSEFARQNDRQPKYYILSMLVKTPQYLFTCAFTFRFARNPILWLRINDRWLTFIKNHGHRNSTKTL